VALAAGGLGLLLFALVVFAATPEAILPPLRALRLGVRLRVYGEAYWLEQARRASPSWTRALGYCQGHPRAVNCAAVLDARWIYELQQSLAGRRERNP